MREMVHRAVGLLVGWVDGSYIDRPACDAAFGRMHARDAIGDRLHLGLACLALVLLSGPASVTEIAVAPLLVFFFVRVVNTGPVWVHGFGQPAVLAALALFGWLAITLAWSPDPAQGMAELNRMRWFLMLPVLYPVIERRGALVYALAAGLMVATTAQLLSAVPALGGLFPARHPGRVTGWWEPVVGGTIQVGAIGLFLAPALVGTGRARWIGLAGLALSMGGLLASGTRGAWLSAAALLVVAVPVLLWRGGLWRRGARGRRSAMVLLGVLLGAGLAAGVVFREGVTLRVEQAAAEIRAAREGAYASPTGARIAMMRLAVEEGLAHPLRGVGAGGVRALAEERLGDDQAFRLAHAHSTPAHLLMTGGVPALLLGGLLFGVLLRNAWAAAPADPRRALELGLPFAILGLVLASVFDVVLINMQVAALLGALAALSPAYMPKPVGPAASPDG